MKKTTVLIFTLLAGACFSVSSLALASQLIVDKQITSNKNIDYVTRSKAIKTIVPKQPRTQDFPTQIIRFEQDISSLGLSSCKELFDEYAHIIFDKLDDQDVGVLGFLSCDRDEEGRHKFIGSTFIDPYTDDGVSFLQNFIAATNGTNFLGRPIEFEPAKGVVISLAVESDFHAPDAIEKDVLYTHKNKLYFNSYYDADLNWNEEAKNIISNKPDLIAVFVNQWMQDNETLTPLLSALSLSNFIYLTRRPLFIMDKQPRVYNTGMWYLNNYDCSEMPTKRCLS